MKIPPYAVYNSAPTPTIEIESNKFLLRTLNPFVINLYRSFIVLLWWLGETIDIRQGFLLPDDEGWLLSSSSSVTNDLILLRSISHRSIPGFGLFHMFHRTFSELIIHKLLLLFVCYSDIPSIWSWDDPTLMMWIINFLSYVPTFHIIHPINSKTLWFLSHRSHNGWGLWSFHNKFPAVKSLFVDPLKNS